MAFTVAQVLNRARDQHPALDPVNTPLPLALRYLSECSRELYQAIAIRVPAYLAVELEVALPLASFEDGVDLTTEIPGGWKDLLQGDFQLSTPATPESWVRAPFFPWEQRDLGRRAPAFTLRHNVIYFLGQEQFYSNYSNFKLSYTAIPTDLTADTNAIPLPDDARGTLALQLAAFFIARLLGSPSYQITPQIVGAFDQRAGKSRADFLDRIWRTTQRQDYSVRDVRGMGGGGGGPW